MPCVKDEESHNNNGYESAASFSLGHNPNGAVTKHLLQRRVCTFNAQFTFFIVGKGEPKK